MKRNFMLMLLSTLILACESKENKSTNIIGVYYANISMDENYGKLCKPPSNMVQTIIKNKKNTITIYKDTVNFNFADTLKLNNDGEIFLNSKKGLEVDSKKIEIQNKSILVKKVYVPQQNTSVDASSGIIIYLNGNSLVAKYGNSSNRITLYRPELYGEIHKKMLYKKDYFKRHEGELEGYMP